MQNRIARERKSKFGFFFAAHLVVIHFFHPLNGGCNEQRTKLLISVWEISFLFFLYTSNMHFKRVFTLSLSLD